MQRSGVYWRDGMELMSPPDEARGSLALSQYSHGLEPLGSRLGCTVEGGHCHDSGFESIKTQVEGRGDCDNI